MDVFTRVESTLSGKERDRAPYFLSLSLYGAKVIGVLPELYYKDADLFLKGQKKIYEKFKPDIMISPFSMALEASAFGSEVKYFNHQPPNIIKHVIDNINEVKNINLPDIKKDRGISYILNSVEKMAKYFKNKTFIASAIHSPTDLPIMLMGMNNWIEIILFHKDLMYELLNLTKKFFKEYAKQLIKSGTNILVIPTTFCNPVFLETKYIKDIMIPVIEDCTKDLKVPIILHHGGIQYKKAIYLLEELTNITGYFIDYRDNIREIREIVNKEKILIGNLNGAFLNKKSIETIEKKCEKIIEYMKEDNRTVFGTSAADIPIITDESQIKIIIKTIERFQYSHV